MRKSKRDLVLDHAIEIVASSGLAALTYDSVATASGMTKSGLMYHFASKDDLLRAMHERMAAEWDQEMLDALGTDYVQASVSAKVAAYARISSRQASAAELLLLLDARANPEFDRIWSDVARRWTPDFSQLDLTDPQHLTLVLTCLAADGLYASYALGAYPLTLEQRKALAEQISGLTLRPEPFRS